MEINKMPGSFSLNPRNVLDAIPYPACITDSGLEVKYQNKKGSAEWGELTGKNIRDAAPTEDIGRQWEMLYASALKGKEIEDEYIVQKNSNTSYYRLILRPVYMDSKVRGVLNITVDITQEKKTEELVTTQRNLGNVLSTTSNLGRALDLILRISVRLEHIDSAAVLVWDSRRDDFEYLARRGFAAEDISFDAEWFYTQSALPPEERRKEHYTSAKFGLTDRIRKKIKHQEGIVESIILPLRIDTDEQAFFFAGSKKSSRIPPLVKSVFQSMVVQVEEVLARVHAEKKLEQNEERYRIISELTSDYAYSFRIDQDGTIALEWITDAFRRISGYSTRQIFDMTGWISIIHPDDKPRFNELLEQRLEGVPQVGEYRILTAADTPRIVRDFAFPIWDEQNGRVVSILGAIQDITESKNYEGKLISALEERNVMLQEIHHRVKNNLQIISSLLDLQANALKDPELSEALRQSRNRVQSMARIHEQLYTSHDLVRIDMESYINKLIQDLIESFGQYDVQVDLIIGTDFFNLDYAIPTGLLINELVSNCFKHAFPDASVEQKKITIVLDKQYDTYQLSVSDNGVGLAASTLENNTLGIRLISMIIRQLDGTLTTEQKGGTTSIITFPARRTE
ncbi:MAG: histidine kinase dimerization/phosphoacceptor domain -containing protein [Spirochaetia bacterium]